MKGMYTKLPDSNAPTTQGLILFRTYTNLHVHNATSVLRSGHLNLKPMLKLAD